MVSTDALVPVWAWDGNANSWVQGEQAIDIHVGSTGRRVGRTVPSGSGRAGVPGTSGLPAPHDGMAGRGAGAVVEGGKAGWAMAGLRGRWELFGGCDVDGRAGLVDRPVSRNVLCR